MRLSSRARGFESHRFRQGKRSCLHCVTGAAAPLPHYLQRTSRQMQPLSAGCGGMAERTPTVQQLQYNALDIMRCCVTIWYMNWIFKLQGGAKFPTGGIVREPAGNSSLKADSVKLRNRQYSLDGRSCVMSSFDLMCAFALRLYVSALF